ncbi:ATP-binding protein [Actinocorallia sp. API 0066]|uniref:AAA family ATPase n=1 Tax=Actinocorallia sp. API 0066 TaxID=2896846 RepID=UPI001E3A3818|nr:ATP-binding protein [Actinocorallia sp. API 0066]MCD0447848.1 ATP-binding protein [Actinocorallia sp. API 0066]
MLLSFRAANHRSLRDEQHLLLTPVYPDSAPRDAEWGAVPVVGVFGPNASGKSNVLDALTYMRRMVRGSFRENEPGAGLERHPYALDSFQAEPSSFVVDLSLPGPNKTDIRYEYGFCVDDRQVTEEWMYSYPLGRRRRVFHRTLDGYSWGSHTADSMRSVEDLVESNVLFLSVAARSKQDEVRPVYDWFFRQVWVSRPGSYDRYREPLLFEQDDAFVSWLTRLLRSADTGIQGTEIIEESEEEFAARLGRVGERAERHASRMRTLVFRHRGEHGTARLDFRDQSTGTRSLIGLSRPIFNALRHGATVLIDELDASLHPYLSAHLIGLFQSPDTNPQGAQLIFTTHDAALLGRIQGVEVLKRDQIWFTEKDECGRTELFPLTDFKPRKDDNRELRYLAGRYGAVPTVTDELALTALAQRGAPDDVPPDAQARRPQSEVEGQQADRPGTTPR